MSKKLLIIEGTDNTGKDTLISLLKEKHKIVKEFHCSKPTSKTPIEQAMEQDDSFIELANKASIVKCGDDEIVLFNRAWYGEYVYGVMYRGRVEEDVAEMISEVENIVIKNFGMSNVIYITLVSGNPKLQSQHEDGESLSGGKADVIVKESLQFIKAFDLSKLANKYLVTVTDDNGEFRPKEDILSEVESHL